MKLLNKKTINSLPLQFDISSISDPGASENAIVHIGVGGFHRAHQAYAIAKLIKQDPIKFAKWRITGVGVMPQDKKLIEDFKSQDHLYTLRMVNSFGDEELMVIDTIQEFLHLDIDLIKIVQKIANSTSRIVSLTITEGGYNYDFERNVFKIENKDIQEDIINKKNPKTVFGLLALALQQRKSLNNKSIVLLSCDNIIGNGDILKKSLLTFLQAYDASLFEWAKEKIFFPNCMVDRITPVPKQENINDLRDRFGLIDNCLVVSEDYFQWVIEKGEFLNDFPALDLVAVDFVEKVADYEKMKLGILNGGHTLVGLLGFALGYRTIHHSVSDPTIANIFQSYVHGEVIPVLSAIEGVDYHQYFELVKTRFSNAMINDSTDRIISFTSDKFPKFILPVLQKQLEQSTSQVKFASIIVAAWWFYLHKNQSENAMELVVDNLKEEWRAIFADEESSIPKFIAYKPVFGDSADNSLFLSNYLKAIELFREGSLKRNLETII